MLTIQHPEKFSTERHWIEDVIFTQFLGIEYKTAIHNKPCIQIVNHGRILELSDQFFQQASHVWLTSFSLPDQPLNTWDSRAIKFHINLVHKTVPVIYGQSTAEISNEYVRLGIDIFGSAFFMLSRYEEYVTKIRDNHNRFPSYASLAGKEKFLGRPIIDEYVEILWTCMNLLWPDLQRKKRTSRLKITCDVDRPFDLAAHNIIPFARKITGDLVKRRNYKAACVSAGNYFQVKRNGLVKDPFWCFDWIMDVCENSNTQCSFYFLTDHQVKWDAFFYWNRKEINALIAHINQRGHEIGLHTSYTTYRNPEQTSLEFNKLLTVCERLNIQQTQWGGRQHFLRWQAPTTWRNWEQAGLDYDTTLCYADAPGFRCGTCHPYPVYDVELRKALKLIERPLIVMEATVLGKHYLGHNYTEGLKLMLKLKQTCRQFDGEFGLLWHNSSLNSLADRETFQAIVGIN